MVGTLYADTIKEVPEVFVDVEDCAVDLHGLCIWFALSVG